MKKTIVSLSVTILCCAFSSLAQEYFQQEVNYTIHVKLDDKKNTLHADETIVYTNHSPDDLSFIYMHLWPNAYKNKNTALAKQLLENGELEFHYSSEKDRGYIDSIDFKVNGQQVKTEYDPEHIDICKIILNQVLKSGESITITTPFYVKIPLGKYSRLGHMEQQYQITQWYPKPAVYDANGWNQMPYLNQGEFYSEFGTYDVYITLPENYVIGATGDMINGEVEMEWLNTKVKETEEKIKNNKWEIQFNVTPPSDSVTKTIHFHQEKVHDFAWFADKRYNVLKGEVEMPQTKKKVTTWVMFTNNNKQYWEKSIPYLNDALYYYSLWNGDYPYNNATAVDGTLSAGGGMEYPNITVIGKVNSNFMLENVIMHEIGHNWFYGIIGSNERKHPWMDEGINSFNENRYIETKYPDAKLAGDIANGPIGKMFDLQRYKHKSQYELLYLLNAAKNEDQPIELPAFKYTTSNYPGIVYSKTAIAFDYLMAYLGEKKFDAIMQKYFDTWKFKHPQPKDLRKIFQEESGRNLDWFFDDMIGTTKKLDYKICNVNKMYDGSYELIIKNTGAINGPIPVSGIKDGKQMGIVWYDGFTGSQTLTFPASNIDYFKIDIAQNVPEINRNNNTIRTHGLFKKTEPIKLQFLGSLDNPDKCQLFWAPALGWNKYNKTMLGMAFYNSILPRKVLEFEIMPFYGFGNKDLAGGGRIFLNFFPDGIFQRISIGAKANRYAYASQPFNLNFNKIAPELNVEFRKREPRSPFRNFIQYRYVNIARDHYTIKNEFTPPIYVHDTITSTVHDINYTLRDERKINPYDININLQSNGEMFKAGLTGNYQITLRKKKWIDLRIFAGAIISGTPDNTTRFKLAGRRGYEDYLYDHIFIGRTETEGLFSHQFTETEGAFKSPTSIGQTSDWLLSLNIKTFIPKIPLVKIFADIGYVNDPFYSGDNFLYEAGLYLSLVKNTFEIYIPLISAKPIQKELEQIKFEERIRFTLNLNLLDPFTAIRNFNL